MRHRLEDLGRIMEKTKALMEHPLLDLYQQRPKDFIDWMAEQTEERRDDILNEMAYGIQEISFSLGEIWEVATGQDYLNERDIE